MKKYLLILFIFYTSFATNIDNLLDVAFKETGKGKLNQIFKIAFKSYN